MNYIIPKGTLRLFIGVPIDKHCQQRTNELIKPVRNLSREIRWMSEDNRHLTLVFLGDKLVSEVEILLQQFDKAFQREKHFQYNLSALARFPDPKGRIIALTGDPTRPLVNLFQVTRNLLQQIELEFDQKKFRPESDAVCRRCPDFFPADPLPGPPVMNLIHQRHHRPLSADRFWLPAHR